MKVFRQVAELRSITRAARVLHLSQPAVTRHVRLLEEELAVSLFQRSAQGMALTPAGLVYLQHVQAVCQAHEEIVQQLQTPAGTLTGRLRVGSNKTVLAYCLPDVLAAFKRRFPTAHCDVIDGNTETIIGALLDRRIDLAVVEGPCRRPELQRQTFLEDEIVWICAPAHPLATARRAAPAQVLREPLITREIGAGSRQFMEAELRRRRTPLEKLNIVQEAPGPEAIKRLVASGLGISFVFRISLEMELAAGQLAIIACPQLTLKRPFSVLTARGSKPQGLARAFCDLLLEAGRGENDE